MPSAAATGRMAVLRLHPPREAPRSDSLCYHGDAMAEGPQYPPDPDAAYLGKYRLLARLGTGGMAEVLLGRLDGPAGFSKHFAIKRMRPELTAHREFVDLFLEEARTASLLSHPNICQVNELYTAGGDYFMVLEYLEGVPVSSVLVKALSHPTALPIPFLVGLVQQACEGLHYAHEMADERGQPYQIIHRDISPPNLFVTVDGVVKVLDFGISKSRDSLVKTLTGQIRGKFSYMSPEQLRGEKLDRRSDVFSLGIVLFELITGRRLFRRKSRLEVFKAVVKEPIPRASEWRSDLPGDLVSVLEHALARDRNGRFDSARAFGEALGGSIRHLGGVMSSHAIGARVRGEFHGELDARRQLLVMPPGVALSSAGPGGLMPTQPSGRQGPPPASARSGVLTTPPEDTSVDTTLWSRSDVTAVDARDLESVVDGDVGPDGETPRS
jgi:serine/threonine protein kinase